MSSKIVSSLKQLLPAPLKSKIRKVLASAEDMFHPGIPPSDIRSHISPLWLDFKATGRDQLEFLIELAGLMPNSRILDIASGVGRLAIPLSDYLDDDGSYEGFDVFDPGIEWCVANISSRRPNFRFQVAQLTTPWSPNRGPGATDYIFPYKSNSFDLAYAGSIFTHLKGEAARNYLAETARVLKPGGSFVSTWLLYSSKGLPILPHRSINRLWPRKLEDFRTVENGPPESSILFDEVDVRSWFDASGFELIEPLRSDATYNISRKPEKDRAVGMNLYYAFSLIAVKRSPQ